MSFAVMRMTVAENPRRRGDEFASCPDNPSVVVRGRRILLRWPQSRGWAWRAHPSDFAHLVFDRQTVGTAAEQPTLGPLPLEPFRYASACAFLTPASKPTSLTTVHHRAKSALRRDVMDDVHVRLLGPRTCRLLRSASARPPRGGVASRTQSPKAQPTTTYSTAAAYISASSSALAQASSTV